jgi:Undecaprenyl-phosphate galactose phosphotransferase WbaP
LETLQRNRGIGLKPVAILDDNPLQYEGLESEFRVGPIRSCLDIAHESRVPYAIICMPGLSRHQLLNLMDSYGHCFRHVMVVPDLIGMACLGVKVREVGGVIGLEVAQNLLRPSAKIAKRTLDLLLTLALAPIIVPIVLLSAILIKLESRGPAFYANERIGHGGRKFKAWKLRSMFLNNEEALRQYLEAHPDEQDHWDATQKLKRDPRVTRVGRIIRKTSIDELPQFWNVLIGEMSVVGPRPFLESQIAMYGPAYTLYQRVRPGITGLWQISGRNHLPFKERVRMDVYTIQNWSVWLDIYILARTISVVLTAKGAY